MMCENRILLKGGHAIKVVDDVPDATMVFMDGQVKSHLLVLATNSFLHQLIKSSWVPGEISTFLMPQHSVMDMLLEFSLPLEIYTNGKESFDFKFTPKDILEDQAAINCGPSSHPDFIKNYLLLKRMFRFFRHSRQMPYFNISRQKSDTF